MHFRLLDVTNEANSRRVSCAKFQVGSGTGMRNEANSEERGGKAKGGNVRSKPNPESLTGGELGSSFFGPPSMPTTNKPLYDKNLQHLWSA